MEGWRLYVILFVYQHDYRVEPYPLSLCLSFALAMLFISLLGRSILRRSDAMAEAEVGIHDTSPRALLDLFILVTSDISIWG
jgi:hypothetical protein